MGDSIPQPEDAAQKSDIVIRREMMPILIAGGVFLWIASLLIAFGIGLSLASEREQNTVSTSIRPTRIPAATPTAHKPQNTVINKSVVRRHFEREFSYRFEERGQYTRGKSPQSTALIELEGHGDKVEIAVMLIDVGLTDRKQDRSVEQALRSFMRKMASSWSGAYDWTLTAMARIANLEGDQSIEIGRSSRIEVQGRVIDGQTAIAITVHNPE